MVSASGGSRRSARRWVIVRLGLTYLTPLGYCRLLRGGVLPPVPIPGGLTHALAIPGRAGRGRSVCCPRPFPTTDSTNRSRSPATSSSDVAEALRRRLPGQHDPTVAAFDRTRNCRIA